MNFFGINPIRALIASAVINGLLSVPVLVLLLAVARNPKVMGKCVIPRKPAATGRVAAVRMMGSAVLTLLDIAGWR